MGTEVAMSGGGSGLFRDVLEGSFPELYMPPEEPEAEEAPPAEGGEGEGEEGGEAPPPPAAAEEGGGKDGAGEDGDGEGGDGEGGEPAAAEEPDEYQQRIADIDNQVRRRTRIRIARASGGRLLPPRVVCRCDGWLRKKIPGVKLSTGRS